MHVIHIEEYQPPVNGVGSVLRELLLDKGDQGIAGDEIQRS